jgi:hypothetical protein
MQKQKQKPRFLYPHPKIQQICYFAVSSKRSEITFVLAHSLTPTKEKQAKATCRLKLSLEKILKTVHSKKGEGKMVGVEGKRNACCWLQHKASILLASFQKIIKFSRNLRGRFVAFLPLDGD